MCECGFFLEFFKWKQSDNNSYNRCLDSWGTFKFHIFEKFLMILFVFLISCHDHSDWCELSSLCDDFLSQRWNFLLQKILQTFTTSCAFGVSLLGLYPPWGKNLHCSCCKFWATACTWSQAGDSCHCRHGRHCPGLNFRI